MLSQKPATVLGFVNAGTKQLCFICLALVTLSLPGFPWESRVWDLSFMKVVYLRMSSQGVMSKGWEEWNGAEGTAKIRVHLGAGHGCGLQRLGLAVTLWIVRRMGQKSRHLPTVSNPALTQGLLGRVLIFQLYPCMGTSWGSTGIRGQVPDKSKPRRQDVAEAKC